MVNDKEWKLKSTIRNDTIYELNYVTYFTHDGIIAILLTNSVVVRYH